MGNNNTFELISDEKIVTAYNRFEFPEDMLTDLNLFLLRRKNYLLSESPENLVWMQQAFDNIYHDTKLAFHMEIIAEKDFFDLIEMLREGV